MKFILIIKSFLGSRKLWTVIFLLTCSAIYLFYIEGEVPPVTSSVIIIIFIAITFFRVHDFGGNRRTYLWILIPPVFLLSCLLMRKKVSDDDQDANSKIGSAFQTIGLLTCVLFIGFGYVWQNLVGKKSASNEVSIVDRENLGMPSFDECYQNGIDYFSSIGTVILTSPPDKGRFATEVVEERCRRSGIAFGR